MNQEGLFYIVLGIVTFFGTMFAIYQAVRILLNPEYAWKHQKTLMRRKGFDTSSMKPNPDWQMSITCRTAFTVPLLLIGILFAMGAATLGFELIQPHRA